MSHRSAPRLFERQIYWITLLSENLSGFAKIFAVRKFLKSVDLNQKITFFVTKFVFVALKVEVIEKLGYLIIVKCVSGLEILFLLNFQGKRKLLQIFFAKVRKQLYQRLAETTKEYVVLI